MNGSFSNVATTTAYESIGVMEQTEDDDDDKAFLNFYEYYRVALQVTIVLGIFGNVINIIVLNRLTLRNNTFVYIFWLAVADLGHLLMNSQIFLLKGSLYERLSYCYPYMFALCHLTFALGNGFSATSALLVSILAIDRHRAVCRPLECTERESQRRVLTKIAAAFLFSFLMYGPVSVQTRLVEVSFIRSGRNASRLALAVHTPKRYHCEVAGITDQLAFRMYVVVRELTTRAFPVALVFVLNVKILLALRKYRKDRQELGCSTEAVELRGREESRLTVLLVAVSIMFLVCETPQVIAWCFITARSQMSLGFRIFDLVGELLLVVNAAGNFYLYCLCSAAVRKTLADLFVQLTRSLLLLPTRLLCTLLRSLRRIAARKKRSGISIGHSNSTALSAGSGTLPTGSAQTTNTTQMQQPCSCSNVLQLRPIQQRPKT